MMPTTMPTFCLPPKSIDAAPESMPCTPMMASIMTTTVTESTGEVVRARIIATPPPTKIP